MMTASIPMLSFAADTTGGKTNTPFNYVALGDASTTGYGMTAKTGYGIAAAGTYPVLIRDAIAKNQFKVTLDQLGMGGMRVEDLRYLLDDSYSEDPYMKEKFPDLANYREKYREAIKNADLITYGLGSVDLGSYLLYVFSDPEKNCCDEEVKALAAADADGIKASLNAAIQNEINNIPSQLRSPVQSAVDNMAGPYIDAIVYVYYSFCMNYDKTLALIKEKSPDADVIVLGLNNMLGNLNVKGIIPVPGTSGLTMSMGIGNIYKEQLVDKVNQHMKNASNVYGFVENQGIEKFLDEASSYNGNPGSLSSQMKDYMNKYEDDLILSKELEQQLARYLSSKRTRGMSAGYDVVAEALKNTAQTENVEITFNISIVDLTNESKRTALIEERKERYADMGKKILAGLKSKAVEIAVSYANLGNSYDRNLNSFIANDMYCPLKLYSKEKEEALGVGRLIMAIGIKTQMGDGFFQQPSARGHAQIRYKVLQAYADKYLHLDQPLEPTCETAGIEEGVEFWQNVVSGKCYSDEAHTTEVSKADYTIPPLGHKWGSWVVTKKAAFCKDGVKTSTCTVEGCGATKTAVIKGLGPAKTRIIKRIGRRKSFTIKWKKPSAANLKKTTGYQIRYSLKKTMKNSKSVFVKKNKTNSKTFKKLKAKKKYWVQIRTYKLSGGKKYYSGWSIKKYVKTK